MVRRPARAFSSQHLELPRRHEDTKKTFCTEKAWCLRGVVADPRYRDRGQLPRRHEDAKTRLYREERSSSCLRGFVADQERRTHGISTRSTTSAMTLSVVSPWLAA